MKDTKITGKEAVREKESFPSSLKKLPCRVFKKMKKNFKKLTAVLLCLILALCLAGCGANEGETTLPNNEETTAQQQESLWASAVYNEDTELGQGTVTIAVEVKAEEKSITFTVHTDKKTLGEALVENELVEGEDSAYGLYIKSVNGIYADYDQDSAYWSLLKDGEYMNVGADSAEIADGEHYEIVYTTA